MSGRLNKLWLILLILSVSASLLYLLLPAGLAQGVLYDLIGFITSLTIFLGVHRNRPRRAVAWYLMAAGQLLFVAGDATYNVYEFVLQLETFPFPSVADLFYLLGYPFIAIGLFTIIRSQNPRGNLGTLIDATLLTLGVGILSWVFIIDHYMDDTSLSTPARLVSMAYPSMDLLLLGMGLWLLIRPGPRTPAFYLLNLSLLCTFLADTVYLLLLLTSDYSGGLIDGGWLISYALIGAAALHPSMRSLSEPVPLHNVAPSLPRLTLLAVASCTAPLVLVLADLLGISTDVGIIAAASVVMFMLVFVRLADMVRERVRAYRQLSASELRFSTLLEQAADAIVIVEPGGKFLIINSAAAAMIGYTQGELVEMNWRDIVVKGDGSAVSLQSSAPQTGQTVVGEFLVRHRSGSLIPSEISVKTLDDGRIQAIARDITDRKLAEENLMGSLSLLQAALEATADGILIVNQAGAITGFNRKFVQLLRLPEAIIATRDDKQLLEFVLAQLVNASSSVSKVRELYEHPQDESYDILHFKDGRVFERYSQPQRIAGKTVGRVWSFHDVTERTRSAEELGRREYELSETKAFLESLIEASPGVIFKSLPTRETSYVSSNVERVLGYTVEEASGEGFWLSHVHEEERARVQSQLEQLLPEQPQTIEHRFMLEDGSYRWVNSALTAIIGDNGNVVGVQGYIQDITERKRAEDERRAREAAEEANLAKSEFLSRMSHELRTPLNAILGFGQLLGLDDLTSTQRESVDYILKGGQHLLGLINEVLDIARIESGHVTLSLEPVNIREIMAESLDMIMPLAAQHGISTAVDISAALDGYFVLADKQRLKQVLLNLLSNAVKYNRDGGRVTLSCEQRGVGRVRIAVSDTGFGITAENITRIFMPFERLGAERSGIEGTGLGLALSKGLVEIMGGSMGLASTPGEGSTFWLELQLTQPPVQQADGSVSAVPLWSEGAVAQRTVLYIEDNLSNLRLVEGIIKRSSDIKLLSAMQGGMGLELARLQQPDLILLDVHLPDMTGVELLRYLQADPLTAAIPVVVVSADATPRQVERLLSSGARYYLTKPLDVQQLLNVMQELLSMNSGIALALAESR